MKKKLLFKLFIFAVIGAFVTVTSCKDYDDDISRLDADLTALKSSKLEQSDLSALQSQLTGQISALQTELNTAKTTLAALQSGSASKDQITALQAEIATLTEELNALKNSAASKEQIESLQADISDLNEEIATVQTDAAEAAAKVAELQEAIANAASQEEVDALKAELAAAKEELAGHKEEFEALQADIVALSAELAEAMENFASKESVAEIEAEIAALNAIVEALESNSVTKEMLEEAKEEVLDLVVKIETFTEYKEWVDTELAALKAELAEAATKEEVTALGDLFDSEIASVRTELALAIASLEALETVVDGNSAATAAAIADVETALEEQLAKIEANATEIAAVKADLERQYDALTAEIEDLKLKIDSIREEFNEALNAAVARLDAIDTELEAVNVRIDELEENLGIEIASFSVIANSMITGISFDYQYDDAFQRGRTLDFSTAPARVSSVFGEGFPGAIKFVSGERLQNAEATLEVKVSPATADLSKMLDKITLVRRDGNNAINDILKVVKAERSTKLRASGPSVTGLWTLTFQMPSDANIASLSTLVEDATGSVTGTPGPYLFALAIENSIDTNEDPEDRYVVSDFGVDIDATPKTPIYNYINTNNLEFSVGTGTTFTSYKSIKNRYAISENFVTVPVDQMWNTGVWNTTAPTTVNDPADDRWGFPFYPVEVGKTFSVKLDASIADKVYAYYVVLDEDYALESAPSEWNAWSAYNYEGLNQVYYADETAALKINSTSAVGDFIGFRVVVVNQDGTLVDPDGKSFYVTVGAQSSSWNAVNTVVTAHNPNELLPTATESAEVNVTLSAVTGANSFTWTTDAAEDGTPRAFDVFFLDANDNILFGTDGTGAVTANFANVKKVYTVATATVNGWLDYTDNKVYNGTLTINNANGNVLRTLNVSFKKVLPTGAPEGFSVKTNQIATDGVYYSYLVPNDWTAPLAIQGTMPLNQVFNFGTGLLTNYQTTFAASAMSGANLVSTVVTGANTLSVAKEFVDNTTQHATTVAYNYGQISTATPTVDYKVTILSFPTVFSNIYNHTYSWRWATRADLGLAATAALPYSTSIEYGAIGTTVDLAHIFGVSTRDSQYNAFLDNPYLASLQVISAKLVSNANGLDEYFDVIPDPLGGATVFTLTQKSGSTNPTADVASTLVLTAKDMYDNDVEIELPMTVTKR